MHPRQSSLVAQLVKYMPAMWETWAQSLDQEYPLEKEMVTHSSTLAWRIPWTEEQDRLQSMESQRVGQDCVTNLHFHKAIYKFVQCNPHQITNDIFHRNRTKIFKICLETQKNQNSQSNLFLKNFNFLWLCWFFVAL